MLSVTDAPNFAKGYGIHIFFILFAMIVSAGLTVWAVFVGQKLRGKRLLDCVL